jgi:glycosyltransferase involved in cell wall biosynthesis
MNIAVDVRTLLDKNYSGVGEYTYNLLKNIFKADKENKYFLFYNTVNKNLIKNLPKFNYDNVFYCGFSYSNKLLNLSFFLFGFPKADEMINKKFKDILGGGKIDIFFVPNLNFISISDKCRKIITVHDLSFEIFPEFYSLKRRIWHKAINFKKQIKKFDSIIAVSKNTKNDLINIYGIGSGKIKVIYSGIHDKYRVLDKKQLGGVKDKYNLPQKFILYVGNLEPRKNIESFIEALSYVSEDVKLVIVGGIGWKKNKIFKTIKNAGAEDRVIFTGYIDDNEKIKIYNLAKAFIYPSYYEGFGFPPLESLACNTPVITSYSSSLPEVVGGRAIIVDPFNISEIKEAIKIALSEDFLIQKNLQKFTWEIASNKFIDNLSYQQRNFA